MEIQIDNPTGTYSRREKERDQSFFFISDKAAILQAVWLAQYFFFCHTGYVKYDTFIKTNGALLPFSLSSESQAEHFVVFCILWVVRRSQSCYICIKILVKEKKISLWSRQCFPPLSKELHRACSKRLWAGIVLLLMKRATFELLNPYLNIRNDRDEHLMSDVCKNLMLTSSWIIINYWSQKNRSYNTRSISHKLFSGEVRMWLYFHV